MSSRGSEPEPAEVPGIAGRWGPGWRGSHGRAGASPLWEQTPLQITAKAEVFTASPFLAFQM